MEPAQEASDLIRRWRELGVDYVSAGPVRLSDGDEWLQLVPNILGVEDALFASAEIGDLTGNINPDRCVSVGQLILRASRLRPNGFGNLYFAALANCPPGMPFFPVAYHDGGPPTFALAVEAADLAVRAFRGAKNLQGARSNLVRAIEEEARKLVKEATTLSTDHGIHFSGIDFTLAPFPTRDKSLAGAIESLGVPSLGRPGSLFAAALTAEAIDRASFPRCGFSGLMFPVLEDNVLAQRAGTGAVKVGDLLAYAAVCGVGLDTIPLPGDISPATLAGILLDITGLAARLDKPLTARLMPLPGRKAGDPVQFDFAYFAEGNVMAVRGAGVSHLLSSAETFNLRARLRQAKGKDNRSAFHG